MIEKVSAGNVFSSGLRVTEAGRANLGHSAADGGPTILPGEEVFPEEALSKEEVEKIVRGLNDFVQVSKTTIRFEFHEKLNEYYVTVVDSKTDEVVREIPSRKMLDIYAAMTEYLGLMVDKKI
nr:flagellar protein FlaG [Bacillus mediterraneensis]